MTYRQTLAYLYEQLPMFHRIGAAAYKADLDNTIAICNLLSNPQNDFKSIHIAGTNGKGSTSHMLAAILQCAGYKTGLYTSPHLKDFRERIRINGKMISGKYVCDFVEKYKYDFERIKPSFFEWTVGLAFDYFRNKKVDVAIIETGLGGRLDSTNIITPCLSVITNISLDHTNLLGNTLQKIAKEKAGIIKPQVPVVIGEENKETDGIFIKTASQKKSHLSFASSVGSFSNISLKNITGKNYLSGTFHYYNNKRFGLDLNCELTGHYQKKNLITVLKSVEILNVFEEFKISDEHIKSGFEKVISLTGLKGRWQFLSKKPLIIADTAHNEAGIKEVLKQIKTIPHRQLHFVIGMVNDKEIVSILKLLPKKAVYYFCKANIPRGLDAQMLAQQASTFKLKGSIYPTVKRALSAAKKNAQRNDLIFVGGSNFTIAEVL